MTRQEIISALDQALEKTLAGAEAMSDKDKKVYFDDLNRNLRFFSWRSSKPNIDVGRICSQLKNANGGGHKNSAGCYMSLENGINFVKQITNY